MWKEFRDFITKGNLLQLAVAFIMGVAFATLVKSFIEDIIMPIVGKAAGNVDFANLYVNLSGQAYESANAARAAGAAAIYYGAFINNLVNFLLIAFVVFLLVKAYMRMQKPKEVGPPTTKDCQFCKTMIPIEATRCPNCTSELGT
ncbi:MAG TPA: large conductance mechanosensitive channel protein MscL [Candidatus Heimdallarchaeota archaeon]|nr:large conductance mechanosensitive channel protein MscL [Candidatus Heimdallarchaeota archaeon]